MPGQNTTLRLKPELIEFAKQNKINLSGSLNNLLMEGLIAKSSSLVMEADLKKLEEAVEQLKNKIADQKIMEKKLKHEEENKQRAEEDRKKAIEDEEKKYQERHQQFLDKFKEELYSLVTEDELLHHHKDNDFILQLRQSYLNKFGKGVPLNLLKELLDSL